MLFAGLMQDLGQSFSQYGSPYSLYTIVRVLGS